MTKHLSKEIIQKIREEVLSGKSKYRTAAEFGLHPHTVYRRTQDIPGGQHGWPGIRGETLKLFQEILQHGYVLSSKMQTGRNYYILKKYFPNICRINMFNKTILFLDDKASVAARAFLSDMNRKIMSFQELKQVTKTFGIELCSEEKHKIIGKSQKQRLPVIRRKDGGFLSSFHKNQLKIDDYMDKNGFLGKNSSKREQKNHVLKNDSLPGNDDSLVDFYIRMY
jgi:hypothetical protein